MYVATYYHAGKFLSEKELMLQEKCCLFCRSENIKKAAAIQESPDVYLFECLDCYAVSASRMPFREVLDKYYNSYYDKNELKITFGNVDDFVKHLYNGFSNNLPVGDTFSILDFGGGNGTNSYALAKNYLIMKYREISISVVDYAETRVSDVPGITLKHYSSLSQIEAGEFDLIIASAVIEHIQYPEPDIRRLFLFLKDNGLFYARTPYVLPFFRILKKIGIKMDMTYPAHLHDLGPKFWNNVIKTLKLGPDFKILSSRPSKVETTFKQAFIHTLIAYLFKFPWYVFGNLYCFVGGWEVFIIKKK